MTSALIKHNSRHLELALSPGLPVGIIAYIPGARYDARTCSLHGSIDAIAVACHRLGLQAPSLGPQWETTWSRTCLADSLRPYQIEGIQNIATIVHDHGTAILADEMGLGKTRQAIAFSQLQQCNRILVVCPASVRETWRAELERSGEPHHEILGPPSQKAYKNAWTNAPHAKWVVTSYELVSRAHAALGPSQPDLLILDEAQLCRGRDAQRSNALERIAKLARYRLMLSGTPIYDRPRDAYKLLSIMFGSRVFGSAWDFDSAYCAEHPELGGTHGGRDNSTYARLDELKLRLSYYMVRRLKSEVLTDLPPKTRQVIWSDSQEGKLNATIEQSVAAQRFLTLTYLKNDAYRIWQGIVHGGIQAELITGDVSHAERTIRIKRAASNHTGIVATIDSTSTGVDGLQHVASTGIMHTLDPVPSKTLQAEDRLHRMGQTGNVHWIYNLAKGSPDEARLGKVIDKLNALNAVQRIDSGLVRDLSGGQVESEVEMARRLYEEMGDE